MEPQEKLTTQQFIIDRLHDIQRKAEANNYTDALTSMKEVKAADVKNIYLIALEKQIIKLTDASLSPENRAEIVKSLPSMIDRAISDSQRRASASKPEEAQKGQKEAALEKLKSQYFQRADDYVEKGEYQRALEEIRRIYIIEPGSVVAKEYEQKIEQLATIHARSVTTEPIVEAKEPSIEIAVTKTPKEESGTGVKAKKSNLPIIAAAAVIVLAVGTWFILSRGSNSQSEQASTQQQTVAQPEESPALSTTSTTQPQLSEPQPEAAPPSKTIAQTPKPAPEVVPVATKQRSTPVAPPPQRAPVTAQRPTRSQPQTVQPTPQPQATQPVAVSPPPEPEKPAPAPPKTESTPAPMPFVAIESPPEIVKREPAKYPEIAYKMRIEGRVVIEVTVDAQGKPIQAKVVRSSSDIFDEAAIEAAIKSTYKPGMMSTGPVTAKMYVPFDFRIKR